MRLAPAAQRVPEQTLTLLSLLVCTDPAFTLIVIQDPSVGTASDPSDSEGAAQRHEHAGAKPPRLGA